MRKEFDFHIPASPNATQTSSLPVSPQGKVHDLSSLPAAPAAQMPVAWLETCPSCPLPIETTADPISFTVSPPRRTSTPTTVDLCSSVEGISPFPSTSSTPCSAIGSEISAEQPPRRPSLPRASHYDRPYMPEMTPERDLISDPPRPSNTSNLANFADRNTSQTLAVVHPLNILVVEDNCINRRLLVSMLRRLGYAPCSSISEAVDGADAIKQVSATIQPYLSHSQASTKDRPTRHDSPTTSRPYDLILMDLMMPSVDGFDSCRIILQSYADLSFSSHDTNVAHPMAPTIIAVTADATEGVSSKAINAGMQGVLFKPFGLHGLEKLIREVSEARTALSGG